MPSPTPHHRPVRAVIVALLLGAPALLTCAPRVHDRPLAERCRPLPLPPEGFDIATASPAAARAYGRLLVKENCFFAQVPFAATTSTIRAGDRGPDVIIQPLLYVDTLSDAALKQGRLVARIKMTGGEEWRKIGLRGRGNVVYVWLKMDAGFRSEGRTSGTYVAGRTYLIPDREDADTAQARFLYEFHNNPQWGAARAGTRLLPADMTLTPGGGGMLLQNVTTAGWLTCPQGCCIGEMPAS